MEWFPGVLGVRMIVCVRKGLRAIPEAPTGRSRTLAHDSADPRDSPS